MLEEQVVFASALLRANTNQLQYPVSSENRVGPNMAVSFEADSQDAE